ncbi:MAG: tetratricopeptide repeat protein [Planctomycetota bacterium]|nr:tetratricopeptide repeat protein [Planctomycetota bacterium]
MRDGRRTTTTSGTRYLAAGAVVVALGLGGAALVLWGDAAPRRADGDTTGAGEGAAPPALAPGALDEVLTSARGLIDRGEFQKALTVLESALAQQPGEQALHVMHAESLLGLRRLEDAYGAYERALASGTRTGDLEFAAGTTASMIGRLDRAEEHYQAAQAQMKGDHRPSLFLAQVQLKLRKVDEAKASLLIAGRLEPNSAVVWGTLAQVALDENKATLAQQHAARARELEPRVTLWRLLEARALRRQGKAEDALLILTALEPAEQRQGPVLSLIGECFGLLGRPAEAAARYAAAADALPTDGPLALETALWFERAGNAERALHYARHARMLAVQEAAPVVERLSKDE